LWLLDDLEYAVDSLENTSRALGTW
jgi:hypothetical protein